jgi:hypothetical protein
MIKDLDPTIKIKVDGETEQLGRKLWEENSLISFLEAYELATGEPLIVKRRSERPDFICERMDGAEVGLELTRLDPDKSVLDEIWRLLEKKSASMHKKGWQCAQKTILVFEMISCEPSDIADLRDPTLQSDFQSYGFLEIWVADYTGLDAYGDVELFSLHPQVLWGYYERPWPHRKPYG